MKTQTQQFSWLNRTVIGASLTSALGDIAHESTTVILPGFLAVLGLPAAALGSIEGIADAISSFSKLAAGYLSDKLGYRKTIVVFGYAVTAVAQAIFAFANGWLLIFLGRSIAWFGRGIRGPLRDAMLTEAVTSQSRGKAYGFHRAGDTIGAVIGPLLGVGLLSLIQQLPHTDASSPFRTVFLLTLIPGFLSVLSFSLLVVDKNQKSHQTLQFWPTLKTLPVKFRSYLMAVGIFGMGDFAHSLLILAATQLLTPNLGLIRAAQIAGILYVVRNITQTLVSFPIGHLADKIGRHTLLSIGYGIGVLTPLLTLLAFAQKIHEVGFIVLIFVLSGVYEAMQDTLESATTADYVPDNIRGIGYGLLGTVNGVGDLVSSLMVGLLWSTISPIAGFGFATVMMLAGTVAMGCNQEKKNKNSIVLLHH